MKNKLNLCLALALLGMAVTAYSTCYLNQVVLCFKSGDRVAGSYAHAGGIDNNNSSYGSFYTDVYADEDSWRYDRYSVTRGGRNTDKTYNSYCVGTCTGNAAAGPYTQGSDPNGFAVHYYNPALGANVSAYNGDSTVIGTPINCGGVNLGVESLYTVLIHYSNPGTTCP
jgi:hypothetical protein